MLLEGWNPYLYLPKTLIEQGIAPMPQAQELYEGMGELSAQHYTNYPPFNQLLFFYCFASIR
jgi:alpha-1,6-mannosyltransferase